MNYFFINLAKAVAMGTAFTIIPMIKFEFNPGEIIIKITGGFLKMFNLTLRRDHNSGW